MAKDASTIRQEIELTRESMGDTVEALGYKADIPTRVKERMQDQFETAKGTVGTMVDAMKTSVAGAADARDTVRAKVGAVQENPIGLALAALAIGFLSGSLLPVSQLERERLGPIRRKLVDQAKAATNDLVVAGKAVVAETAQSAVASAVSSAQVHGHEVIDAAKDRATQS